MNEKWYNYGPTNKFDRRKGIVYKWETPRTTAELAAQVGLVQAMGGFYRARIGRC